MRHRSVDLGLLRQSAPSVSVSTLGMGMGMGESIVDFCSPCNPYFPTPEMFNTLAANLVNMLKYYPSDASAITGKLASVLGLNPHTIAMSNGSTEIITWLDHLLIRESIAVPVPTFGRWTDQPMETGKRVDMFALHESDGFALDLDAYLGFIRARGSRTVVLCNPNNPDGGFLPRREVLRFVDALSDLDLVVVDESFIDFVEAERQPSIGTEATIRPNVVVLKSLGKNFGLHGIRCGYSMANPAITNKIVKALPKWNLNSLAEAVVHMITEYESEYRDSLRRIARDRYQMTDELSLVPGLTIYPSQGNFLLVKLPQGWSGVELRDYLLSRHNVHIRECGNMLGITSQFVRLVVRPVNDVRTMVEGMLWYGRNLHNEPDTGHNADLLVHPTSLTAGPAHRVSAIN